ncbi:DUF4145 domain-containing protein [Stieleria varia]|uniref:Type I restriction enzyme EcoKI subunit R n=1 Tax=Stieleria varia TaxID=2528005 RepID=A0A5C6B0N9_9BACT|nr:DUF4145 domain-containing protein [Stieleria varia]TWU05470.1 type I restriction enzyme EcoKI subunit R [Stieleria varia]
MAYKFDRALKLPYQDNLSALIHEPTFKQTAGDAVFNKAKLINKRGNDAVHSHRDVSDADAVSTVQELFHFCYWFARLYARRDRPDPALTFDPALLPTTAIPKQTLSQLKLLETQLKEKDEELSVLLADKDKLDAEIKLLRTEVAKAKKAAEKIQDDHDYNEAETRDRWIDELLKESGWPLDQKRDREFPVTGMPNRGNISRTALAAVEDGSDTDGEGTGANAQRLTGEGFVDYVLWATMASRWRWSRPNGRDATQEPGNSRQSCMPIAWKQGMASDQSFSTPTGTNIGFGTMPCTPRAEFRASTRKRSWNC